MTPSAAPAAKPAVREERPVQKKEEKAEEPEEKAIPEDVSEQLPPPEEEAPPAAYETVPEEPAPQPQKVSSGSSEGLLDGWDDCVQVIKDRNRTLGALLKSSRAHVTATHLLIEANPMAIKFIRDNEDSRSVIKEAVASVTGVRLPVGPWKEDTQKKKTDEDDGLEEFLRMAEEAGVEVERRS